MPDASTLENLQQYPLREDLAKLPMLAEVSDAIDQLKNNKAAGPDNIPAQIW